MMPQAPTERESLIARSRGRRKTTVEDSEDVREYGAKRPGPRLNNRPAMVTIEHETAERVKVWKKGPYGWFPIAIPLPSLEARLDEGMMDYCPDCGTQDCDIDPITCEAKRNRRSIVCPVPGCNSAETGGHGPKVITATGFGEVIDRDPRPGEMTGVYAEANVETELKAKMDRHILTFHPDEARMLGLLSPTAQRPPLVASLAETVA